MAPNIPWRREKPSQGEVLAVGPAAATSALHLPGCSAGKRQQQDAIRVGPVDY
jgi:hypothetical protein